jgi:hypothetical protein
MEHSLDADGDEEDTYQTISPNKALLSIFLSHFIIFISDISPFIPDLFFIVQGPLLHGSQGYDVT